MFSFGGLAEGKVVFLFVGYVVTFWCWWIFCFFLRQFDRNQSVTDPMWTDGKRKQTRTK